MWKIVLIASLLSGAHAKSQVLVTNRGEPAPFPHFPLTEAEPRIERQSSSQEVETFQFAPTPSGRAPEPTPRAALVARPQPPPVALGKAPNLTYLTQNISKKELLVMFNFL